MHGAYRAYDRPPHPTSRVCALQVFIAVILEGFGDMSDAENSVLSKQQLDNFAHEW